MGFLDDLKQKAEHAKASQANTSASVGRNVAVAEAGCKAVYQYFIALAPHLNVLHPVSQGRFAIDKRHGFDALRMADFVVDARHGKLNGDDVFDHVVIHWRMRGTAKIDLRKDFPPDIQRIESRIRQCGLVNVHGEPVRDPETGRTIATRFVIPADIRGSVRASPDHDTGRVRFQCTNLDALETVTADFNAQDVGTARLDELARWIVGEPHKFTANAVTVRLIEP